MASGKTIALLSVGTFLAATSVGAMAGTGSNSPFASKTKKPKAWETQIAPQPTQQYQPQSQNGGNYTIPEYKAAKEKAPEYTAPTYTAPEYTIPQTNNVKTYGVQPWRTPMGSSATTPLSAPTSIGASGIGTSRIGTSGANYQMPSSHYQQPTPSASATTNTGEHYPGRQPAVQPSWAKTPTYAPPSTQTTSQSIYAKPAKNYTHQYETGQNAQSQQYGSQTPQTPQASRQNQYASAAALRPSSKPSWAQRLGFGNVKLDVSGKARTGVAAVFKDSKTKAEAIVDLDVRAELSAITEGGLEYGVGLRARAQHDRLRRGFGGRVGDCPASNVGCARALVGTDTRSVKGHTGQFYTDGARDANDVEIALEGAYLFLRSAYGDVAIGRDDGAAYLFSLGAPSLFAVGGSNSGVDYTGLDSVKTVNDASGFAEKITYTSPRLLGDTIGVGVQFGVSYSPNAKACGVNYCVKKNLIGATDIFAPEIKNVIEGGLSLDRKFANGMGIELTGTYARGSEDTGNVAFSNLSSWGSGLELTYADFVFGASYLNSNNGYAGDGDYTAYDVGISWQPSNWGVSASFGHAKDDIAQLTSNQAVFGINYDFAKFSVGTGVQYVNRKTPFVSGVTIDRNSEDAVAVFIETGIKF
ncbi:MAG: hypothetical protein COA43_04240 [Robiginitomaculum sp.]|nr:MAG: hypothetical protein COA43_04240 [Robiginitomaculum sp.]